MKKRAAVISSIAVILAAASAVLYLLFFKGGNPAGSANALGKIFETKPLDQVTLTFHYPGEEPASTKEILNQIEVQTKTNINTKVDFAFHIWEKYETDINLLLASNEPCDAFFIYSGEMKADTYKSFAQKGMLKDITELLPKYALDYYHTLKPEEIAAAAVDGKMIALPGRFNGFYRPCAVVRSDLMEKYSIPEIKSFEDYELFLKTIKEKEPALYPMGSYGYSFQFFSAINNYAVLDDSLKLVYKWDDKEMKVKVWEQTPEFSESVKTVNNWFEKGYISKDIPIIWADESVAKSKSFASFISSQGTADSFNSILKANNISDRSYKDYPLYSNIHCQRTDPMQECLVFNAKSPNVERALMFVNWLESSQDNYDLLMYGIKGKNYNLTGNKVEIPVGTKATDNFYNWGWRDTFINPDFDRLNVNSDEEVIKAYKEFGKNSAEYAPHTGFVLDKTELSGLGGNRVLDYYKFEAALRNGTFNETAQQEYVNSFSQLGMDKVVERVQMQIDSWLKSKK